MKTRSSKVEMIGEKMTAHDQKRQCCPICNKGELHEEQRAFEFEYGKNSEVVLTASAPAFVCSNCKFVLSDSRAEEARHISICRHLGLLNHNEIKEIREQFYQMSRREFAETFGFGEASLARWESRNVIQNTSTDNLLRLLRDKNIGERIKSIRRHANMPASEDKATEGKGLSAMFPHLSLHSDIELVAKRAENFPVFMTN